MSKVKIATVGKVLSSEDGLVHLQPFGFYDPCETLCGNVNSSGRYTVTIKKITCSTCQCEYDTIKNGVGINK